LVEEYYPFVLLGTCDIPHHKIDSVESDHEPASYKAAVHLLKLGHRQVGFLTEDLKLSHHRERLAGSERAFAEVPEANLIRLDKQDLASPETFQNKIKAHDITALLCADRSLFLSLVSVTQANQIQIPESLSVVFLSDVWGVPFPNPTRVRLNRDSAGHIAVQRLVKRLAGDLNGNQQIRVLCDFVIGDTTTSLEK
jgi:DNA-binding LacI/PurR family transcriptional regulator